jgi:hypothetical protein
MSTIVDNATDALHSVSGRLTLPDDLSDGVGALGDRIGGIGDAIAPTKTVAVGAGTRAAVAGGRTIRRHPVLVIGGSLAVVAAIVWLVTRRSGDDANATPRGVEPVGARDAA